VLLIPARDGEWIQPTPTGFLLGCCDCGLVHRLDFRIVRKGRRSKVQFRAYRRRRVVKRKGKVAQP
jgi:hypothetical protein